MREKFRVEERKRLFERQVMKEAMEEIEERERKRMRETEDVESQSLLSLARKLQRK